PTECVALEYESQNTVILQGALAVTSLPPSGGLTHVANEWLWEAVDGLMAMGYSITSVMLSGQGTEPNPHVYHVVMSKQ
ncbi:MAG: hypothetical protein ACRD5B_07985, partial [Nitrososphaeraceae archaeon]